MLYKVSPFATKKKTLEDKLFTVKLLTVKKKLDQRLHIIMHEKYQRQYPYGWRIHSFHVKRNPLFQSSESKN